MSVHRTNGPLVFCEFSQKLQFFDHIHPDPPLPKFVFVNFPKNFNSLITSTLTPPPQIFSSPELKAHRLAYSIPMVRRPSTSTMLKDLLLRNCWADQSQILCGASLGRGNDILFAASGSHDQDGPHAHIWLKPFKNLLLQNRRADFHETWYVASGTPAHHSLFK